MQKKNKILCWIIGVLLLAVPNFALEEGATAAFTRLNFHPQAIGMGGAFTALVEGAGALSWNPAGIAKSDNKTEWFVSGTQQYETTYLRIDTVFKTAFLPISLGYLYANFGSVSHTLTSNVTNRLIESAANSGYLGQSLYIGTAKKMGPIFTVGASVGYVLENIESDSAGAFGMDIGMLADYKTYRVGASVKNALEPNSEWGQIPRIMQVGVARKWWGRVDQSVEVRMRESRESTFHAGITAFVTSHLSVQVGSDDGQFTIGTGVHLSNIDAYLSWKREGFDAISDAYRVGIRFRSI
jgi:hypothetical protein